MHSYKVNKNLVSQKVEIKWNSIIEQCKCLNLILIQNKTKNNIIQTGQRVSE